jgi:hypothetical protein
MSTRAFLIFLGISLMLLGLMYWYAIVSTIDYDDILKLKDQEIENLRHGLPTQ